MTGGREKAERCANSTRSNWLAGGAPLEHDGLELNRFERNTSHLAPRTQRGTYLRVFYKNRENNPMQSRMPRLAAVVLHASEKKNGPSSRPT
jgi:hypothetical protein